MENIISFLKNEKTINDEEIIRCKEKINSSNYHIIEIENMVNELSKNIDTTFEIFSPNAFEKDNNVAEIENLNYKKNKLKSEVEVLQSELSSLNEKKTKIDLALDEISDIENEMASNVINTKMLVTKEVTKTKDKYSNDLVNILEYQINKDNHYLTDTINKKLKMLENKFALCENFIDMDVIRAKLEIAKLKEEVTKIIKSNQSEMFHVKHFDNERLINESINEFIQEYKKKINMKIDYSFIGVDVEDSYENITNLIRIVKETIDNSVKHSFGSIINISVVIDKMNEDDEINNENIQMNNSAEMQQINFVVKSTGNYLISIKINDNGNGFTLQDDRILLANDLYGISIMKFRASLLDASLHIDTKNGLGTSVSIIYELKK